ncbi:MAG: alpha/beta hydrolase [Planctomycetota bacterium]|jgi:alpha-beta hydrolase superfamily lysophospholipase
MRKRLQRLFLWLTLATTIIGVVGSLWVGSKLVTPSRRHVGEPPADLSVEVARIRSGTGSDIHGWFLPRDGAQGAIVLGHPLHGTRKTMLGRARLLWNAGYAILTFDFQAHGESAGKTHTYGYRESLDLRAAVEFIRKRVPGAPVAVIGFSLGGAAALLAEPPLAIDALVVEAVYTTIDDAIRARTRMYVGPLGPPAAWLFLVQLEPRLGVARDQLRPIDGIARTTAPVLVLAGSDDQRAPLADSRRLFAAAKRGEELVVFEGAAHQNFLKYDEQLYRSKVLGFLQKHLQR